jgi:hypothetical protein
MAGTGPIDPDHNSGRMHMMLLVEPRLMRYIYPAPKLAPEFAIVMEGGKKMAPVRPC